MKLLAPVSAITAIISAVLFIKLAIAVIKKRQIHKVVLGTGPHPDLKKRVLGLQLTFASLAVGAVANVVPLVIAMMSAPRV